jgi:exonuclease SbcC
MVPLSLTLRNFLSYGEEVPPLDFTQFHVAVLSGANGHGKSALLDGLTYALWGEARKAAHDRKPDEGLLRLGANEMRVEFCFEVNTERYRVIRAFRKGRRTNATQLELQIFDPAADAYHSLSESAALTQTQARIDQLLSMDYTTFINSAFLVQGRADEFTQKNASQRKEILTEILGLERYDRLAEKAREHIQSTVQNLHTQQQRLQELDNELAEQVAYEADLKNLKIRLQTLNQSLDSGDQELGELRTQRQERIHLQTQLATCQQDYGRLQETHEKVNREAQHLRSQQAKDSEILTAAETIKENFASFQRLTAEEGRLRQHMLQLHEFQTEISQFESRIMAERHEVEKRCSTWESRLQALEDQARHSSDLLAQQETIETRHALLIATRQQAEALDKQRDRHLVLQQEIQQLQGRIALEQERLNTQRNALVLQKEDLEIQLKEGTGLNERLEDLAATIQNLEAQAGERDRLKEEGGAVRTRIEQTQQTIKAQEAELADTREKVRLLDATDEAACPLCGSRLDQAHRQQLDAELQRQEQQKLQHLVEQRHAVAGMENQVQEMRQQCQNLEQQTQTLAGHNEERARLLAIRSQLQNCATQAAQIKSQLAALDQELQAERYAPEDRQRLGQVSDELEHLRYQPQQYAHVQDTLKDLASVETEYARLQDALAQQAKTNAELDEARDKLALARKYLDEKLYAPKEQQDLHKVLQAKEALAYDSEAHQRVREEIDELSDAVSRRERLTAAQERHATNQASIEANEAEADHMQKELTSLAERKVQINARLKILGDVSEVLDGLATRLAQERAERDGLLQQQGALQIQYERCLEWAKERETLHQTIKKDQQEEWAYRQLTEAFGKNGIQALIIENAIPEIEEEANAILSRLTDNRIQISIESLRDLKKGGTRETLDIKIADEIGERSYHLYSGGEAFRTNFALRLALSKVLAKRAGTRLRTLIIDEGFGTQDREGLEHLIQAIQTISKDFDKLLVVTHLPEIRNAFPVQIEVTKHPDLGSRFEIIDQR